MAKLKFEVGELAQLKSGGPVMTIIGNFASHLGAVVCRWFAGGKASDGHFPREALKVPEKKQK
jgi:uncharacterized protein YodC (DUF2158 family)